MAGWNESSREKSGMVLTDELVSFIKAHQSDNLDRLLLSASKYPGIDVEFVVDQIRARAQVKDKLPTWYAYERLCYPSRIAAEQCSSERTASYKRRLVRKGQVVCDLTGGLGVDSYFISLEVARVIYMERFEAYCEAARANFRELGATNIEVWMGDSAELLAKLPAVDCFYVDPARRGEGNKRLFALADCEPDLTALLPRLWRLAPRVIAKISPMADLTKTLELLPETVGIHVLSVRNECKELLFEMDREGASIRRQEGVRVTCVNFRADGVEENYAYLLDEEAKSVVSYASAVDAFLYEPNASLLKAGAFKRLASSFGLSPLHVNSHLYTGSILLSDFPGRTFRVDEVLAFNNRLCKDLKRQIPKANITVRNFPLSVNELRSRTRVKEGGDVYLFATTLADGERVLIKASKP